MNPEPLPETLYGLLETAIPGSKKLNRRQYRPHYGKWHTVGDDGPCEICLTGSVMAVTFACSPDDDLQPCMFPSSIRWKLEALYWMSRGHWVHAYGLVHLVEPCLLTETRLSRLPVPAHSRFIGWRQFNAHLRSLERNIPKLRRIE